VKIQHIKGHQDDTKDEITTPARMNCLADELTKAANINNNIPEEKALPHEKWQIFVGKTKAHQFMSLKNTGKGKEKYRNKGLN
jgi:hypothetical protein